MDHANSGLEGSFESIYYPVRRAHAARLTQPPFTQNSGHPLPITFPCPSRCTTSSHPVDFDAMNPRCSCRFICLPAHIQSITGSPALHGCKWLVDFDGRALAHRLGPASGLQWRCPLEPCTRDDLATTVPVFVQSRRVVGRPLLLKAYQHKRISSSDRCETLSVTSWRPPASAWLQLDRLL